MNKAFLIALIATSCAAYGRQTHPDVANLPPLINGTIQLHNTLSEAVAYVVAVTINGVDPVSRIKIINSTAFSYGIIPAHTTQRISSGVNFGGGDAWSVPVGIILQRENQQAEQFFLIDDIVGIHHIISSPSGLLLVKDQSE